MLNELKIETLNTNIESILVDSIERLSMKLNRFKEEQFFIPIILKNENNKTIGIFIPKNKKNWLLLYDSDYLSDDKKRVIKYPDKILNDMLNKNILLNIQELLFRSMFVNKYINKLMKDINGFNYLIYNTDLYNEFVNDIKENYNNIFLKDIYEFKAKTVALSELDFTIKISDKLNFINIDYDLLKFDAISYIKMLENTSEATNFYLIKDKNDLKGLIFIGKKITKGFLIDEQDIISSLASKMRENYLETKIKNIRTFSDQSLSSKLEFLYKYNFDKIEFSEIIYPEVASIKNYNKYINYSFELQSLYYTYFNYLVNNLIKTNKSILLIY